MFGMNSLNYVLTLVAALGCGTIAGVFFGKLRLWSRSSGSGSIAHWNDGWLRRPDLPLFASPPVRFSVAIELAALPDTFHRDPADRTIVATARANGLPVLTRDRRIIDSSLVEIWTPS